jgi:hypothetical protein
VAKRVVGGAAGGVDVEALNRGLVACKTSTALLSSPLVTDSEGETEEGVGGDGELDGEGMGEAVLLWWRRVVVSGFEVWGFSSGSCSTVADTSVPRQQSMSRQAPAT